MTKLNKGTDRNTFSRTKCSRTKGQSTEDFSLEYGERLNIRGQSLKSLIGCIQANSSQSKPIFKSAQGRVGRQKNWQIERDWGRNMNFF